MLDDAVLLQDLIEHFERTPAINHEILRNDLEPIDHRFLRQNVPVMRHPQTNADSVVGEVVEGICRHGGEVLFDSRRASSKSRGMGPRLLRIDSYLEGDA